MRHFSGFLKRGVGSIMIFFLIEGNANVGGGYSGTGGFRAVRMGF